MHRLLLLLLSMMIRRVQLQRLLLLLVPQAVRLSYSLVYFLVWPLLPLPLQLLPR